MPVSNSSKPGVKKSELVCFGVKILNLVFFCVEKSGISVFFVSAENGAGVNKMSRMFFSWSVPGVSNHFKSKAESLS